MIDWLAFLGVAAASLLAAITVVGFYSIGLRLLAPADGVVGTGRRSAAVVCFVVCAAAILFGIYLIVPAFHQG